MPIDRNSYEASVYVDHVRRIEKAGKQTRSRPAFSKAEKRLAKDVRGLVDMTTFGYVKPIRQDSSSCLQPTETGLPLGSVYPGDKTRIDSVRCSYCGGHHSWVKSLIVR